MVTQEPDTTTRFTFEMLISTWREKVPCEITTALGNQCRRPARWRVDVHGCEKRLMCTNHLQQWEAKVAQALARTRSTACTLCGRAFQSLGAIRTVAEL